MRWRDVVLREDHTLADSGTTIIPINITDQITAIFIKAQATNGATSCQNVRVHEDIDKIELVDGSEVLFSCSMLQAMALNFYETGRLPYFKWDEGAAAAQYDTCMILFGRYVGDKGLMLDPRKFKNLQLKITHSLTISGTAGFATTTGRLTVIAKALAMPTPLEPGGCKVSKEIYSWSTAGAGDERVEFPVDRDHIGFMLRVFATTVGMHEHISRVKVTIDEDKYIPLDMRMLELIAHNHDHFGEAIIQQKLLQTDADTFESRIGYLQSYLANACADLDYASIDAEDDGNLTLQLLTFAVTPTIAKATADHAVLVRAQGLCPFNTVYWRWDLPDRPNHTLRVDPLKSIIGKFTQATAAGAASIVCQQIRNY